MKLQELCQECEWLIKSAMSLFENLHVPEVCTKWTTIIWQNCTSGGDMMTDKSSMDHKAMGDTFGILKVCHKSHHLFT